MKHRILSTFILLLFVTISLQAQPPVKKIKAINNYIQFSNESTHGMLIIARLLENFNKKVNKYIETQVKDFNNYSNADLPKDIFLDPENWFYEVSPTVLYDIAIKESGSLNSENVYQMNFVIKKMKQITTDLNQFRFQLEEFVNFMNYKDPVFLDKLYVMLEEAVVLFENFYKQQLALEALIKKQQSSLSGLSDDPFITSYTLYYNDLRKVLTSMRDNDNSTILENTKLYKTHLASFNSNISDTYFSNKTSKRRLKFLKDKSLDIQSALEDFLNRKPTPDEYKDFGRNYYYHNANILNKTNKYGNGSVSEMNKIITKENLPSIMFFEIPHFYKVAVKKITWRKRDYSKRKKRKKRKKK